MMNRREFLGSITTAVAIGSSTRLHAQTATPQWPSQVLDTHLHLRGNPESNFDHIEGCGVTRAVLLTAVQQEDRAKGLMEKYPGRFVRSASVNVTRPDAADQITSAIKDGAVILGELKDHVAADGPELRRMYDLAAELNVPILVHFQDVPHYAGEGVFASGFKHFEAILKTYRKTRFIGHADEFWANISADYAGDAAYPVGPIKPGGLSDRLLADYANLYADLSANSGNNALSRSPEFTAEFLARHQNKLMFGSDCNCLDGNGKGQPSATDPARDTPNGVAARLTGKCLARNTLAIVERSTRPEVFRKIAWENGSKLLRI
jgi:predicted TIM-barrel fold metal-dependent hydrolase